MFSLVIISWYDKKERKEDKKREREEASNKK
jgi:hypothetical protein